MTCITFVAPNQTKQAWGASGKCYTCVLKSFRKYLLDFVLLCCKRQCLHSKSILLPNVRHVSHACCACSVVSSTKSVQADRKSVSFTTVRHQETQKSEDVTRVTTKVQHICNLVSRSWVTNITCSTHRVFVVTE